MALFANTADHRKSGELAWAAPDRATRLWQYAANFAIGRRIGVLLLLAILSFLTLYPLSMLLYGSLHSTPPGMAGEFNLEGYRQILTAENILILLNTIGISIAKTIPSISLAVLLAWICARTDTPGRGVLEVLITMPFFIPPILTAMAWGMLGNKQVGVINMAWQWLTGSTTSPINVYSYGGIVWHMMQYSTPFLFLFIVDAFRAMDPALEESSRMSGASRWAHVPPHHFHADAASDRVVVHAEPDPRHRVRSNRRYSSACPPASPSSPLRSTTRSTIARRRPINTPRLSRSRSWL